MSKKKRGKLVGAAVLNDRLRGDDDVMAAADEVIDYLAGEAMAVAEKLVEMAKGGDREAAIFVLNRLMGTPRQHLDARIASVVWTPDDYRRLALEMAEDAKRMESPVDRGCKVELQEPVPVGEDD